MEGNRKRGIGKERGTGGEGYGRRGMMAGGVWEGYGSEKNATELIAEEARSKAEASRLSKRTRKQAAAGKRLAESNKPAAGVVSDACRLASAESVPRIADACSIVHSLKISTPEEFEPMIEPQ